MSRFCLSLLFAIAVTLHDIEEALWLPGWIRAHVRTRFDPNPKAYCIATSLITVVVWIATLAAGFWPDVQSYQFVLSGFAFAMGFNAIAPHLWMSLIRRSYMPGVITGVLLNLPLALFLIHAELRSCSVSRLLFYWQTILYAVLLGLVAFGSLAALHFLYGKFETSTKRHAPDRPLPQDIE